MEAQQLTCIKISDYSLLYVLKKKLFITLKIGFLISAPFKNPITTESQNSKPEEGDLGKHNKNLKRSQSMEVQFSLAYL